MPVGNGPGGGMTGLARAAMAGAGFVAGEATGADADVDTDAGVGAGAVAGTVEGAAGEETDGLAGTV